MCQLYSYIYVSLLLEFLLKLINVLDLVCSLPFRVRFSAPPSPSPSILVNFIIFKLSTISM